jgi:hypothetical protein
VIPKISMRQALGTCDLDQITRIQRVADRGMRQCLRPCFLGDHDKLGGGDDRGLRGETRRVAESFEEVPHQIDDAAATRGVLAGADERIIAAPVASARIDTDGIGQALAALCDGRSLSPLWPALVSTTCYPERHHVFPVICATLLATVLPSRRGGGVFWGKWLA